MDTKGNRRQVHGGSILCASDTFSRYGLNKERTRPGSGIWHWGVRCSSSTDLQLGRPRADIPPEVDDLDSSLHPARMFDRQHIIHNAGTGKYVC